MASKLFLLLTLLFSLQLLSMASLEYDVGESKGWAFPPSDDIGFYNEWASKNRFQIGDTVVFKYKKDSVIVVTNDDYNQCNSSHPIFFSNNGNTVYKFDRSGPFYFISGVSGHCEKGQKMIIKVLGRDESPPPPSEDGPENPPGPPEPSASVSRARISAILMPSQLLIMLLGFIFHQFY